MTDITERLFQLVPTPITPQTHEIDINIKAASEIVIYTQYIAIQNVKQTLRQTLNQLKSSLRPSDTNTQKQALQILLSFILSGIQKAIESLKDSFNPPTDIEQYNANAIITSLYSNLADATQYSKQIQQITQDYLSRTKSLDKSRRFTNDKGAAIQNVQITVDQNEEFVEENLMILEELKQNENELRNAQKLAHELNQFLGFFSQKVLEHEQMSEQSNIQIVLVNAEASVQLIDEAGRHLFSANENSKGVGTCWAIFFLGMSVFLLAYDWWTAKVVYL